LNLEAKINLFKHHLELKNANYTDYLKDELHFYFFENNNDLSFLNELETDSQIISKVDFLISKIIKHEHEEGINEIISRYV
jgi:hypothetical protein